MTTEAQVQANRANAQKSTGPRTPEGKEKASQNALKHGLLAKDVVVTGEDLDKFDLFRDQYRAELAPVGIAESVLVERIVGLSWRLQRAERFGTESFDVLYMQCTADPQIKRWRPVLRPEAADPVVGLTVVKDFSETKVLERLMVYERRIETCLYRTMAELRQVQGLRRAGGGVPATSPRAAVRDRHPADLSMADQYRPRQRSGTVREVPPPEFTLNDLLAKIAASEEEDKRAGAATNTPAEPACQTKPIEEEVSSLQCEVPSEESPAAAPLSLATSNFSLETAVEPQTCQTNPICGVDERQVLCGPEVTKDAPQGEAGRAKPQEAGYRLVHCVGRPAIRS